MNKQIDVEPLWRVIRDHNLMTVWQKTASVSSESEAYEWANQKAERALEVYSELMASSNNDGAPRYRHKAIYTALGLNSKATRVFTWRKAREIMDFA